MDQTRSSSSPIQNSNDDCSASSSDDNTEKSPHPPGINDNDQHASINLLCTDRPENLQNVTTELLPIPNTTNESQLCQSDISSSIQTHLLSGIATDQASHLDDQDSLSDDQLPKFMYYKFSNSDADEPEVHSARTTNSNNCTRYNMSQLFQSHLLSSIHTKLLSGIATEQASHLDNEDLLSNDQLPKLLYYESSDSDADEPEVHSARTTDTNKCTRYNMSYTHANMKKNLFQ